MKNIWSFIAGLLSLVIAIVAIAIIYFTPPVSAKYVHNNDTILGSVTTADPKTAEQFEIGDIKYPGVFEDAYNSSKDKKYLFNLIKEMVSAYEASSLRANNKGWKDDVDELSIFLVKLLDNTPKVDIIPISEKQKKNMMKIHRNAESHSNYYCAKYVDTKHTTSYKTLIELLSLDKVDEENQQKVIDIKDDEWVIWNWNPNDKNKKLNFCYIINDKDFQILYAKFKIGCEKRIEKSK